MVSIKNLFYLLLLTIYTFKSVNGQDIYTLKECIYRGIEKNISIKNSLIELKLSEADRLSVVGDFLPNIKNINPTVNERIKVTKYALKLR